MLGRSLQMFLTKPSGLRMASSAMQRVQMNQMIALQARHFAKKGRTGRARKNAGETTDAEEPVEAETQTEQEPVQAETQTEQVPEPVQAAPVTPPTPSEASSGDDWSVGDITRTQSVPNNRPPSQEDTIEGRYAYVLFVSASESNVLFDVYEDTQYIRALYQESEDFRYFTQNGGVGAYEMRQFNEGLQEAASFQPQVIKFLEVLAENKRLVYLDAICDRFGKLYQQVNKQERINIISAVELTESEQNEVLEALKENPKNAGKDFNLDFTVDDSIGGGLQMYTETEFKDMSLNSRLAFLRQNITRYVE